MQTKTGCPDSPEGGLSLRTELQRAAGILSFLSETPYLDAKLLLMKAAGFSEVDLVLKAEEVLEQSVFELFRELLERRRKGEPLAYIVGTRGFMGRDFEVSEAVLIPRPETELLVEHLSLRLKSGITENSAIRGLEIGLGSGIISLSLLHLFPNLEMDATDISVEALQIAKRNAITFGLDSRLRTHKADIVDESIGGNFDFLVSNPPYIAETEYRSLSKSIRDYEPELALLAKEEGYYFYDRITKLAPQLLNSGGLLAFEIGYNQANGVKKLMEDNGFCKIECIKDYSQFDRVLIGERA